METWQPPARRNSLSPPPKDIPTLFFAAITLREDCVEDLFESGEQSRNFYKVSAKT